MLRLILIALLCLLASMSASSEELPMRAYEIAETRLLAEWVGLPEDQFILASVYYKGDGVPRDYGEAVKWFHRAAEQGLAKSQHMLAVMYEHGDGMPPDYFKAVAWYREAADQGYIPAQFELGNKYASGRGVPQNYAEAYVWFSLAAAAGHAQALKERDHYARKLSHEEIMEAQRRAARLFEEIQQSGTKQ